MSRNIIIFTSSSLCKDVIGRLSPDECFRVLVVRLDGIIDGVNKFIHTFKYPSPDSPGSHDTKPDFYLIHPRGARRGKMQVETTFGGVS